MPAIAAHYQFGQMVLESLCQPIKNLILKHKNMFDIGLQGPDILFFYKPYRKNSISAVGYNIHKYPAKIFFENALKYSFKSEKYLAYLLGVVCHYSLDKACHPYVNSIAQNSITHQCIESDFEYYLINLYNLNYKRHKYIPKNNLNFGLISKAYKNISKIQTRKAIFSMHKYVRLLEYRRLILFLEKLLHTKDFYSSLTVRNRQSNPLDVLKMKLFFDQAINPSVCLIKKVVKSYITENIQLNGFEMNFEGVEKL